jgi:hypothetical protein
MIIEYTIVAVALIALLFHVAVLIVWFTAQDEEYQERLQKIQLRFCFPLTALSLTALVVLMMYLVRK